MDLKRLIYINLDQWESIWINNGLKGSIGLYMDLRVVNLHIIINIEPYIISKTYE